MHLFCLVLLCYTRPILVASVGVSSTEVRRLLGESLHNMQIVQRTSIISFSARHCLIKFTQIFDSFSRLQSHARGRLGRDIISVMTDLTTPCTGLDQQPTPDSLNDSSLPLLPHFDSGLDFSQYVTQTASKLIGQINHEGLFSETLFS